MKYSLRLRIEFIKWFEEAYPGETYDLRRGRRGEFIIVRADGRLVLFSEYYAGKIIGGLDGEQRRQ